MGLLVTPQLQRLSQGLYTHSLCRHRLSNLLRPLRRIPLVTILIAQAQLVFEVGQPLLICMPRHSSLILEDTRQGDCPSHRACQGYPRTMHFLRVSGMKKIAKREGDVPTRIVVGGSKTSKLICSLISQKDQRNAPSQRASTTKRDLHESTIRTVIP